jgi:hypothetical protein
MELCTALCTVTEEDDFEGCSSMASSIVIASRSLLTFSARSSASLSAKLSAAALAA